MAEVTPKKGRPRLTGAAKTRHYGFRLTQEQAVEVREIVRRIKARDLDKTTHQTGINSPLSGE